MEIGPFQSFQPFNGSMVRPFEKPHGRLPRRPSVPSPARSHHKRTYVYRFALHRIEPFQTLKPW